MTQQTIGELLRHHRLRASLKQKELAKLTLYDHTTISRIERDERLPNEAYLERLNRLRSHRHDFNSLIDIDTCRHAKPKLL